MNTAKLKGLMELYLFAVSIHDDAFAEGIKEMMDVEFEKIDDALFTFLGGV